MNDRTAQPDKPIPPGPIYIPSGRAREYAALACNLYTGCWHGCRYCYAPDVLRMQRDQFHAGCAPRTDILHKLDAQCSRMEGDSREILLCFTCDPYQAGRPPTEYVATRAALQILAAHKLCATILTKAGEPAARDFDILKANGWRFGTTLAFTNDHCRKRWEPHAASCVDRMLTMRTAKEAGLSTWMSVEPVLDRDQALQAIGVCMAHVDEFRVGKLNGRTEETRRLEKAIDWAAFLVDVEDLLRGRTYIIKEDLEQFRRARA